MRRQQRGANSASKASRRRLRLASILRFAVSAQYGQDIRAWVILLGEWLRQKLTDFAVEGEGARMGAAGRIDARFFARRGNEAAKTEGQLAHLGGDGNDLALLRRDFERCGVGDDRLA